MALAARATREETHRGVPASWVTGQEKGANAEYTWLFRSEFPAVVRTAYLILHDRQGAEDVAQQAFAQLFVHWRKVSKYERPEAWVRRVAIRLATRTIRRDRLRAILHQQVELPLPSSSIDIDLVRALKALPPQQRAAVALFYFEDRPVQEIADILSCSESTAKAHLFKARRRLASLLREEEEEVPDAT
jgi:RNA polymerase sigma-70 factor (ECF subfamily)